MEKETKTDRVIPAEELSQILTDYADFLREDTDNGEELASEFDAIVDKLNAQPSAKNAVKEIREITGETLDKTSK